MRLRELPWVNTPPKIPNSTGVAPAFFTLWEVPNLCLKRPLGPQSNDQKFVGSFPLSCSKTMFSAYSGIPWLKVPCLFVTSRSFPKSVSVQVHPWLKSPFCVSVPIPSVPPCLRDEVPSVASGSKSPFHELETVRPPGALSFCKSDDDSPSTGGGGWGEGGRAIDAQRLDFSSKA